MTKVKSDRHAIPSIEARAAVAQTAARLIAEGQEDYEAAKHKAARLHGILDTSSLPNNREMDDALRQHFALFSSKSHTRILRALRETALQVMTKFEHFSPWLVGGVLNGTANEFSEIELELVGIGQKDFEFYMINNGLKYAICDQRRVIRGAKSRVSQETKYCVEFNETRVCIVLFESHAQREAKYPRTDVRHERVQRAAAERKFIAEGESA